MDPELRLHHTRLQVRPGEQAQTTATVRYDGDLIEQYTFDVLGAAARWADVVPREVSVTPGVEYTVRLLFRPPAGPGAPVGNVPFALRCRSRENRGWVAVEEGDIAVSALHEITAAITTVKVRRGRWTARWIARFDNRGTAPARLCLSVPDGDGALGFALAPKQLDIAPGGYGEAFLKARAVRPFLRGTVARHPVRLGYARMDETDQQSAEGWLDAAFEQLPVLPRAAVRVAGVALLVGVAAAAGAVLLGRVATRTSEPAARMTASFAPAGPTTASPGAAPTASASSTNAAEPIEPQGAYVIFRTFPTDDKAATDRQAAEQFTSDIQQVPGVGKVQLMDSRRSQRLHEPPGEPGVGEYVVLKDGFAGYADATGYCAKALPALRQSMKNAYCIVVDTAS
ncbi:hypothetical protein [Frankia sp. Cj5]|uniref:COG1470 family protein n=1 Tax=Frankia sp. Cj5 TaxID=2880978 RepID=UPI001EF5EEED|nr:hypothetical protein [Frankia sp. Cj5]